MIAPVRSPAEWEPQVATWLSFPHNEQNWPGERGVKVREFYYELLEIITRFQPANLLVEEGFEFPGGVAQRLAKKPFKVSLFKIPTDDIWLRDYGPFFVKANKKTRLVAAVFNAWGEKFPPWGKDSAVPQKLSDLLRLRLKKLPYILEGGAIEFNGDGFALTSLPCLSGPNRNSADEAADLRRELKASFGLDSIVAIPEGLEGDHTDGHIDNVARFVAKDRVVMSWEPDTASENYRRLSQAKFLIERFLKARYGANARVDTLPLPPQKRLGHEILPASYSNFIFVNGALIFPKYDEALDPVAAAYFKSAFPAREVIGIDATTVIEEGGSLHCLTKHQPA